MTSFSRLVAVPLSDKRLQLWAVSNEGSIWSCWESSTASGSAFTHLEEFRTGTTGHPFGWRVFPSRCGQIAAAPLADKRLQLFGVGESGAIWTCWKEDTNSNSEWTLWTDTWTDSPSPPEGPIVNKTNKLAAAPLADKRLQLWAVTERGDIFSCWQKDSNPNSKWTYWVKMPQPPNFPVHLAAAPLADGRLQLWLVPKMHDIMFPIWSCWKKDTNSNSEWTSWMEFPTRNIPLRRTHKIAVAPLVDKRLQLWGLYLEEIWSSRQRDTNSNSEWTSWMEFPRPGGVCHDIASAPLADGRLALFAIEEHGRILICYQFTTDPNSEFSGWQDLFPITP